VHILRDVEGQFYVPPEDLPLVRRVRTVHGRAPRLALSYDQARHLTGLCIKAGLAVVVEI
jgi:hypothetical protein